MNKDTIFFYYMNQIRGKDVVQSREGIFLTLTKSRFHITFSSPLSRRSVGSLYMAKHLMSDGGIVAEAGECGAGIFVAAVENIIDTFEIKHFIAGDTVGAHHQVAHSHIGD